MTVTRTRDGVPGWSGDPSTWLEFKQSARLFVASTKYENRYTCGPKIAAELTGAAKTAITGKKSSWLSDESGAEKLLNYLQTTIGEPALPEVGNFMRQYFKVLRRKRGEAMSAFCVRHREEYERMCRSLARMVKEHKSLKQTMQRPTTSSAVAPSDPGSQAGVDNLEGPRPNDTPAHTANSDQDWSTVTSYGNWWQDYGWYSSWSWYYDRPWSRQDWYSRTYQGQQQAASEASEMEEDDKVDILPDAVLGWFLLEKSGLDSLEKSVIQGEIKGDFTLAGVEHALRSHWSDDQVRKRDGDAKHVAAFQDEDEEEPIEEDAALFEDWSQEELSWYQDAKAEEQRAWIQFQQAKRTLREARAKQHEVKMSRKYYRSSSVTPQRSSRAWVGGHQPKQKGPCFKCGSFEHQVKQCPQREESAKIAEEEEEHAEYTTFFNDAESDHAMSQEKDEDEWKLEPTEAALMASKSNISTEQAIHEGKAVLDGGATRTMASVHALEKLTNLNQEKWGTPLVNKIDRHDRPVFGFGNSEKTKCVSTCHLKVPHEGQPLQLRVHVLNQGQAPILLSVDSLRRLGAIIDFSNDQAIFSNLAPDKLVQLERSQAGHQLLPLSEDFLKGGLQLPCSITSLSSLVQSE